MNKSVFLSIILILITILVAPACGPKQEVAPPAAPVGNQPPVIESLVAAQNQTYPGGMVDIRSSVSDANKDMVNYKWSCSGGNFRETGPTATWIAPSQYGSYDITLAVDDGKGGSTQSKVTITVSANNPPRIESVKADPASVQLEGSTTLTIIASDPDNDAITYSLTAKEGTVSGQGNKATWIAPRKQGNFTITAIAKDAKGGESRMDVVVMVSSASNTVTLSPVKSESGTVNSTGDKDNSFYKAGDDEKNIGYRAFFSFNIQQFQGMEIRKATLKLIGTRVVGDPYDPTTGIGNFQLRKFSWGEKMPAFNTMEGGPIERGEAYLNKPIDIVDVTPEMVNSIQDRAERFQVEAAFMKKTTNGNSQAEFVQWNDAQLEITAAPK